MNEYVQENPTEEVDAENIAYIADKIPLSVEFEAFSIIREQSDLIYVSGRTGQEIDGESIIYAVDLRGNIVQTYTEVNNASEQLADFYPDDKGNLWVMKLCWERDDIGKETLGKVVVRCYNKQGSIISEDYIDSLISAPLRMLVDSERSCIYFLDLYNLYVFGFDGQLLFKVENANRMYYPCFTSDSVLAICEITDENVYIRTLDYVEQMWGDEFLLDVQAGKISEGHSSDLLCGTEYGVYEITLTSGDYNLLFNWIDVGLKWNWFEVSPLENSRYLVATESGLYLVEKKYYQNNPPQPLILATFDYDLVSPAVIDFNVSQNEYRIEIKDYSQYNLQKNDLAGLNQLQLDIASGNAPDIYDLNSMPVSQYAELGMLEDLYPYIDGDAELNRRDFGNILTAQEINGGLFYLMPHCTILTLVGSPDVFESIDQCTYSSILALADGEDPFGGALSRYDFLKYAIGGSGNLFINWSNRKCSFNSDEFMDLLELTALLPENVVGNEEEKLLTCEMIGDYGIIIYHTYKFGCDDMNNSCVTLLGMPGVYEESFVLCPTRYIWGISSGSLNKEAAWLFVRTFLQDEYQQSNMIPLSNNVLNDIHKGYARWISDGGNITLLDSTGVESKISINTEIYYDAFETIVESVTGVYDENQAVLEIVWDEAQAYFAGDKTVEQVADNIQSRANIYLAEQG